MPPVDSSSSAAAAQAAAARAAAEAAARRAREAAERAARQAREAAERAAAAARAQAQHSRTEGRSAFSRTLPPPVQLTRDRTDQAPVGPNANTPRLQSLTALGREQARLRGNADQGSGSNITSVAQARAELQAMAPGSHPTDADAAAKAREFGLRLVAASKEVEASMPGTGLCATGVDRALAQVGVESQGNGNTIGDSLPRDKFKQVDMPLEQALKIPGAILCWEKTPSAAGSIYGHTAVSWGDGHTSSSDFTESDTVGGSTGREGLKVYIPTGAAAGDTSPAGMMDAGNLKKIVPNVSDEQARKMAPVLADAMNAAKVKTPEQAAAFVAMMDQGTKGFSNPDSLQYIVDSTKTWNEKDLNGLAQDGKLNHVAQGLGMEVTQKQLENDGNQLDPNGDTKEQAFAYFVNKGLTKEQAAGIVGNLMQESGVDPNSVQQGGPGRGIAQWSVGERWTGVEELARKQGKSPQDLGVQLDYLWQELNTTESGSLSALKSTSTAAEAAVSFEENFERAGIPNNEARIANANSVLQQFGNKALGGGDVIGGDTYERALSVFAPPPPPSDNTSVASGGGSSGYSGSTSSSGGGGTVDPSGTTSTTTPPARNDPAQADYTQAPGFNRLQSQVQQAGFDTDPMSLWCILQMLNQSNGALLAALSGDPDFQAFCKAHPGMSKKAAAAAFLGEKMKAGGITASMGPNGKPQLSGPDGAPLKGTKDVLGALGIGGPQAPAVDPSAPSAPVDPANEVPVAAEDPAAPVPATEDPTLVAATPDTSTGAVEIGGTYSSGPATPLANEPVKIQV